MIVWKGLGILAVVIPFGLEIIFQLIFGDNTMFLGLGYLLGGILVWILGRRLNTGNTRIITNPETGQQAVQKLEHSMFWIKLELWAPIFILLGGLLALSNQTNGSTEKLMFPLVGSTLLLIGLYTFYQNRNNLKLALSASPKKKAKNSPKAKPKTSKSQMGVKSTKPSTSPAVSQQRMRKLSEEEQKKKQFYEEIRRNRNNEVKYEPSDHSRYMPKKNFEHE